MNAQLQSRNLGNEGIPPAKALALAQRSVGLCAGFGSRARADARQARARECPRGPCPRPVQAKRTRIVPSGRRRSVPWFCNVRIGRGTLRLDRCRLVVCDRNAALRAASQGRDCHPERLDGVGHDRARISLALSTREIDRETDMRWSLPRLRLVVKVADRNVRHDVSLVAARSALHIDRDTIKASRRKRWDNAELGRLRPHEPRQTKSIRLRWRARTRLSDVGNRRHLTNAGLCQARRRPPCRNGHGDRLHCRRGHGILPSWLKADSCRGTVGASGPVRTCRSCRSLPWFVSDDNHVGWRESCERTICSSATPGATQIHTNVWSRSSIQDAIFRTEIIPFLITDPFVTQERFPSYRKPSRQKCNPVESSSYWAGVYATSSRWIIEEVRLAQSGFRRPKPIIAIEPWGSKRTSTHAREAASKVVRWNTESIVTAIRELQN